MDKATEGHMKELCRVIKYALDTRTVGLRLKPEDNDNKLWELKAYSDADFAGDKETRISVTGKLIWTREEYELEASRITTGRVLRGIVNHSNSNSESQIESLVESQIESLVESQVDSEWRHNRLSGTNRYEVLENYDEVENGTSIKSVT